jgi:V-type H+-transporting ATPase subunit H
LSLFKNPRVAANLQTLYVAEFNLWLLTFHDALLPQLKRTNIVLEMVHVLKTVSREKVVRMAVAILYNLVSKTHVSEVKGGDDDEDEEKNEKEEPDQKHRQPSYFEAPLDFAEDLVGFHLHKTLPTLLTRKFKDEGPREQLEYLDEVLRTTLRKLSSFDMYFAELKTGYLSRSPVHTENFWQEHYRNFSRDNYDMIQRLSSLLDWVAADENPKNDIVTLEMACYDLGEFARFHPEGRRMIGVFNIKHKLMALMDHPNNEVRKQALLSVQKVMIPNWDDLNKTAKSGLATLRGKR